MNEPTLKPCPFCKSPGKLLNLDFGSGIENVELVIVDGKTYRLEEINENAERVAERNDEPSAEQDHQPDLSDARPAARPSKPKKKRSAKRKSAAAQKPGSLANRLQKWMNQEKLTAVPASKKLGVSEGVIRRILRGKKGYAGIDSRVAKALDKFQKSEDPEPVREPPAPISAPTNNGFKNPEYKWFKRYIAGNPSVLNGYSYQVFSQFAVQSDHI